ncbi:MAG: nitroreductase [Gammaproteobacteria bacterium]
MNVLEAINGRQSVRAFLPDEVPLKQVEDLLQQAARAPSGGNLQPWKVYVLTGQALKKLIAEMPQIVAANPQGQNPEYSIYPPDIKQEYEQRRRRVGLDLYAALGIGKEDRAGRIAQMMNNFKFFGAPVGMFFSLDRQMDRCQWADVGMYMQNLMLLAREHGLDTCPQECWALYPEAVARHTDMPSHEILFCGMALGYADAQHPSASLVTERESLQTFVHFLS